MLTKKHMKKKNKIILTPIKRRIYECDAETIAYYRRNPVIACRDLLGINLLDSQKWILQMSWISSKCLWACSRNFGKSFLASILIILFAMLYENQNIYIVSSVGDQAKQTFTVLESLITRVGKTSASIKSLQDIAEKETVKSNSNKTGFSHNPAGYEVEFYNGSKIFTLNSKPDSARSRRANLVFFDEASFCSDELIIVCEAFCSQSSDFVTSTDENYSPEAEKRKVPNKIIYASSQNTNMTLFYKYYKDFSKKMIAGDRDYFVCDMICDVAIETYLDGKKYAPLLSRKTVDTALSQNRLKAEREYFNRVISDNNIHQPVKWATIRRAEQFYLPNVSWKPGEKYVIAFDPARTGDNSIVGIMKIYEDEKLGWCGDIINVVNMIDVASAKGYKLDSNRQLENLREMIVRYNGQNPDYENIDMLEIDSGSGGGGVSTYADNLLNEFTDSHGKKHRGFLDPESDIYKGYELRYPNNSDKIRVISPKKYRTQMFEECIELMDLGVIRFPFEYDGRDFIKVKENVEKGEETFKEYELSNEEKLALANIDLMKAEITAIEKIENKEKTTVTYALSPEAVKKNYHDDRAYVLILLAHRLYELRRKNTVRQTRESDEEFHVIFRKPKSYA